MKKIIDRIYVGDEDDDAKAVERGFSILVSCKDCIGGHREILGYHTMSAPQGPNYLWVEKGKRMSLNCIDSADPNMIPWEMLQHGLEFAVTRYIAGDSILFHCRAGHSRGPTTALLFLRSIGEMPHPFQASERVFKTLYSLYDPGQGMRQTAKSHWNEIENQFIAE